MCDRRAPPFAATPRLLRFGVHRKPGAKHPVHAPPSGKFHSADAPAQKRCSSSRRLRDASRATPARKGNVSEEIAGPAPRILTAPVHAPGRRLAPPEKNSERE